MKSNQYQIEAKVWLYPGMSAWHFLTIPKKESAEMKEIFGSMKKAWGSLPVMVTVGKTIWKTSLFPDKKAGAYLLPLKAAVRKKEKITEGDTIILKLEVELG